MARLQHFWGGLVAFSASTSRKWPNESRGLDDRLNAVRATRAFAGGGKKGVLKNL